VLSLERIYAMFWVKDDLSIFIIFDFHRVLLFIAMHVAFSDLFSTHASESHIHDFFHFILIFYGFSDISVRVLFPQNFDFIFLDWCQEIIDRVVR